MFPNQLLNHPQKVELAVCWFSATLNEKSFKKRYKSATINKIDSIKIEEILQIIRDDYRSNGNGMRFSLYVSSQLMYGIIKLHSYQTMSLEKEVLEMQQKLDLAQQEKEKKEKGEKRSKIEIPPDPIDLPADPIDLPPVMKNGNQVDKNLLPDLDLDYMKMLMDDACLNFGVLTDEELDLLEHNSLLGLLENRVQIKESKPIQDHSEDRENINKVVQEMLDLEITEEIRPERYQTIHSPGPVDIVKTKSKSKEPSTPQKRVPQDPLQVATPKKRRCISLDTVTLPEDRTVQGIQEPIPGITATSIPPEIESELELPLLDLSLDSTIITKKPKKMIDKKISLKGQLLQKQCDNINYKCRQPEVAQLHHIISARDLLKQPSRWDHERWAGNLRNLFKKCIAKPLFRPSDKNIVPTDLMQSREPVRAEETSRVNVPEISGVSIIAKDATIPVDEPPETAPDVPEEDIIKDITKSKKKITDTNVDELDKTLKDVTTLIEDTHLNDNVGNLESPVCSSKTSQVVSHDILGMLESLWCDKECIKFDDLIPDTYSRKDITATFYILLKLHAEQKIILMQKDCHDTLSIRKYSDLD